MARSASLESDHVRDNMCIVAAELFVSHGYDGFTIQNLAFRLGAGPLEPYRWFEDKNAILAAARTNAFVRLRLVLERASCANALRRFRATTLCSVFGEHAVQNVAEYRLMFDRIPPCEAAYPELVAAKMRAHETMQRSFRDFVLGPQFQGDPELLSCAFWSSLHGGLLLMFSGALDQFTFEQICNEIVRTFSESGKAEANPKFAAKIAG